MKALRQLSPLVVVAVSFLVPPCAQAQSHLDPEATIFGGDEFAPDYAVSVRSALTDLFGDDVVARMIAIASFAPENGIGVRKSAGRFEIIGVDAGEQIWGRAQRHPSEPGRVSIEPDGSLDPSRFAAASDKIAVPVQRCALAIDDALAHEILDVWKKALLDVRFGHAERQVADGETFHFSLKQGPSFMAGRISSPEPRSTTGMLVALASTMREACRTQNPDLQAKMRRQVNDLLGKLS